MALPWKTLHTVSTQEGQLELRQRGEREFLIVIAGRVLMTSAARRSEEALAVLGCAHLSTKSAARVLVGGLGMAYTLRAALDVLPKDAEVTVAELTPQVVDWCRGPLAPLTDAATADPRVRVHVGDVARLITESSPGRWDAILLDLYEGPNAATQRPNDPFYGAKALARAHAALGRQGVLAIWAEDPDIAFPARFEQAGFQVNTHRTGKGGRAHVVYVGVRTGP